MGLQCLLSLSAALLAGLLAEGLHAQGRVLVSWRVSPDPQVTGYMLAWGTNSRAYAVTNKYPATQTVALLTNLSGNRVYYIAVAPLLSNGQAAPFSKEIVYTNNPGAPASR
jgi:hypothetical protein